jgi:hypothetical protein
MNRKLKIALLGLLGLSTAACCSTKKTKKSQDNEPQKIEAEEMDPRIQLMYGVPFPDGQVVRPVEEGATQSADAEAVRFPDGSLVKPLSNEEAMAIVEEIKAEEAVKEAAKEAAKESAATEE